MTVIVPHKKTKEQAMAQVDQASTELFAGVATGPVKLTDQKKNWQGSTMSFSVTGKMGFISVPLSGTVLVDDTNVTIECDLPPIVKNFIGEGAVRTGIEQKVKGLLA